MEHGGCKGLKTDATTPRNIPSDVKPPGLKPSGRINAALLREHTTTISNIDVKMAMQEVPIKGLRYVHASQSQSRMKEKQVRTMPRA